MASVVIVRPVVKSSNCSILLVDYLYKEVNNSRHMSVSVLFCLLS